MMMRTLKRELFISWVHIGLRYVLLRYKIRIPSLVLNYILLLLYITGNPRRSSRAVGFVGVMYTDISIK